jgi:hypothetical protein
MPTIGPLEALLANLRQYIPTSMPHYLPKEAAYRELKSISGQDFGDDVAAWEAWCHAEDERTMEEIRRFYDENNSLSREQAKKLWKLQRKAKKDDPESQD